jgi:hypothetical protein
VLLVFVYDVFSPLLEAYGLSPMFFNNLTIAYVSLLWEAPINMLVLLSYFYLAIRQYA